MTVLHLIRARLRAAARKSRAATIRAEERAEVEAAIARAQGEWK